jgi:hypothetical protein
MTGFEPHDIIGYLIKLFAVAPAIIITVMYSFLARTEADLTNLRGAVKKYCHQYEDEKEKYKQLENAALEVNKFVIISAKYLHLGMSYYLLMLASSLAAVLFDSDYWSTLWWLIMGTCVYFLYFWLYLAFDIWDSFNKISDRKRFVFGWMAVIIILYGAAPLLLPFADLSRRDFFPYGVVSSYLAWITLTSVYICFWWLVVPYFYKPLTNLSYIRRTVYPLHNSAVG